MFKSRMKKIVIALIIIVLITGGVSLANESSKKEHGTVQNLENILMIIKNYYVEDISLNQLINGAIEGIITEIDPYSNYMSSGEYDEMQEDFEGEFGGIGIQITVRDDKLTIISPISDTPGERAGLRAGDVIAEINGEETADMSQEKAVDLMRGEPGTDVVLSIDREGEDELIEVEITREVIEVPIVETEVYDDKIGYLSISQFIQETGLKTEEALKELEDEDIEALILDLRNNPGGILDEAVNVSSLFADKGTVLSVKQREGEDQIYEVDSDFMTFDLPVVVLINRGSASASEIVSGFIKDQDIGKLLGSRTFGKGTVQSVFPLEDGSALRLTTARYYTSGENLIDEVGIEPDYNHPYIYDEENPDEDNQLDVARDLMLNYLEDKNWPEAEEFLPELSEEELEEISQREEEIEKMEEELENDN
ncbi:MAG: S41 family peptidase [Halanaerobiaceae bacterium]